MKGTDLKSVPNGKTEEILQILAEQNTIPILREMNRNGWYSIGHLAERVSMDAETLKRSLVRLYNGHIVDRRFDNSGRNDWEYRLLRDIPNIDLKELLEKESHVHDTVRFYTKLIFRILEKTNDLDRSLLLKLRTAISRTKCTNRYGMKLLETITPGEGYAINMKRANMVIVTNGFGELEEAKAVNAVKNAYLAILHAMIDEMNMSIDKSTSKLVMRNSSRELIIDADWLIKRFDLLQGLPETYFTQVC